MSVGGSVRDPTEARNHRSAPHDTMPWLIGAVGVQHNVFETAHAADVARAYCPASHFRRTDRFNAGVRTKNEKFAGFPHFPIPRPYRLPAHPSARARCSGRALERDLFGRAPRHGTHNTYGMTVPPAKATNLPPWTAPTRCDDRPRARARRRVSVRRE
jgi:hypothetical protein